MISSLFSSGSPPQPSSASVTTTATGTTATSSPTTANQSKTNTLSSSSSTHPTGGGPSTTTSVSSPPAGGGAAPPPPPPPAAAARAPRSNATTTASHIQPSLPSPRSQRAEADARAAVVASISNMLDGELQSRAALLHANNAAIDKQRRDVEKAVAALRKEDDKLQKVADDAARRVKEVGDVQNWAELLEKDFLVLEETLRLAARGSGGSCCSDGCDSCCSGSYYSGSYSGSEAGDAVARTDAEGDVAMDGEGGGDGEGAAAAAAAAAALSDGLDDGSDMLDKKGKGKELLVADASESMELDEPHHNMSEASRSITDASSSHTMTNETGKSSETTSLCAPTTGV